MDEVLLQQWWRSEMVKIRGAHGLGLDSHEQARAQVSELSWNVGAPDALMYGGHCRVPRGQTVNSPTYPKVYSAYLAHKSIGAASPEGLRPTSHWGT